MRVCLPAFFLFLPLPLLFSRLKFFVGNCEYLPHCCVKLPELSRLCFHDGPFTAMRLPNSASRLVFQTSLLSLCSLVVWCGD